MDWVSGRMQWGYVKWSTGKDKKYLLSNKITVPKG